jgi:hypothetical protein
MFGANVLQAFVHHPLGDFRQVAFSAEMTQIKVAQLGGHDFLRGIGGIGVGKMAVTPGDPLFQAPRAT